MEYIQKFAYEVKESHAVIWRCYSHDSRAAIPEIIEGYPVGEIAPYAFSEHLQKDIIIEGMRSGRIRLTGGFQKEESAPLCGSRLEEINLPSGIEKVGAYVFYNCINLKKLSFPSGIQDWGTGAFTGCHQVRELFVKMDEEKPSTLMEVLAELKEELCVRCQGEEEALLMFPEFFEEGVENTPARILETHVHGTGLYYRNCFWQRRFDYREYDSRFQYAMAQESTEFLLKLAFGRLQYPWSLNEHYRQAYLGYLKEHTKEAAAWLIEKKDLKGLAFLAGLQLKDQERLTEVLELANKAGYGEGISFLMQFAHEHGVLKRKRNRFEL